MSDDEGAGDGATGGAGVPDIKKPTASAYYDWSADKSKRAEELSRMGVDVTPKVVSPAAAPVAAPLAKAVSTGSAWNAAGTWEERDVSSRAVPLLRSKMAEFRHVTGGYTIAVVDVPTCDGTVTVVYSRGKPRPGYEVSLKVAWSIAPAAAAADAPTLASGTVAMADVSDTEGSDMFGSFRVETASATAPLEAPAASRLLKDATEAFRAALRDWVEAVKAL